MFRPSHFLWWLCALTVLVVAQSAEGNETSAERSAEVEEAGPNRGSRALYAIAHRVLTVQGVKDALSIGANGLEIDATATTAGWFADHSGSTTSTGETMKSVFTAIAEERSRGQNIVFVWLDIKTPDRCDPNGATTRACSIVGLRDLARQILQPAGVQVLYGFLSSSWKAYPIIANDLNANEAVNLDGAGPKLTGLFDSLGPSTVSKRVMSYGSNELGNGFGDCTEASYYTCTELRQAVQSRKFGAVYGWTLSVGQKTYAEKMLGDADVDGIIYGFKNTAYYDHPNVREPLETIKTWVKEHPEERRYLATRRDRPW